MSKAKILIVEDDQHFSDYLTLLLIQEDFNILDVVTTSGMAVKRAVELKPDLILMDFELDAQRIGLKSAKEIQHNIDIPIIYILDHEDNNIINEIYSVKSDGYIVKSSSKRELNLVIERALYKYKAEQLMKLLDKKNLQLKEERQQKKKIEEVLKENENNNYLLQKNTLVGIYEVDLKNGKILNFNEAMIEALGYSKEELISLTIYDLLTEQGKKKFLNRMK